MHGEMVGLRGDKMGTNYLQKTGMAVALLALAGAAQASPVHVATYNVSDTAQVDCGSSSHGLWTNSYLSGSGACGQYFSFDSGTTLDVDSTTDSATLTGTATNSAGIVATIDIEFGGFGNLIDSAGRDIKTGGGPYDRVLDDPDWDFFHFITKGEISFDNGDVFRILLVEQPLEKGTASVDAPVLQIGEGANDKTGVFGASTWLNAYVGNPNDGYKLVEGHWDLNMDLAPVPIPAAAWLFGSALMGLVGFARRKNNA